MTPHIAILGAGPSGLALARLLEVKNIEYVVFERDESADAVTSGGTLDIHTEDGQLMLKEAGLFEEFRSHARYDGQATLMVDGQMNVVWDKKPDEGEEGRPEIDRKVLREILLRSVPERRIQWNRKVEEVVRDKDGSMEIHFENGFVERGFKLVVGADGAWSKARSLVSFLSTS